MSCQRRFSRVVLVVDLGLIQTDDIHVRWGKTAVEISEILQRHPALLQKSKLVSNFSELISRLSTDQGQMIL
jgi:hypothetical protein